MSDLLHESGETQIQDTHALFEKIVKEYYEKNMNRAIADLTRLVEISKRQEDYMALTRAYNLMGAIYSSIGSTAMEVDCYLEALSCATEHNMHYVRMVCLNNLGAHYQESDENERAVLLFTEALNGVISYGKDMDDHLVKLYFVLLENLTLSNMKLQCYEVAEEYYESACQLLKSVEGIDVPFDMFLLKCMLDWHNGKKDEVWDALPELEKRMQNIWEPVDFLSQIKEYVDLLRDMKAYDYWKRISFFAYKKIKQYNSKTSLLEVLQIGISYVKAAGLTDSQDYVKLCKKYVDTSLELKEKAKYEKAQIANVKMQLYEEEREKRKSQQEKIAMQEIAEKDSLTGLGNRYSLRTYGRDLLEKSKEDRSHLIVGILDVDCFKQYNDTYGHIEGDRCLTMISNVIKSAIRRAVKAGGCGKAFRYGGDEFLVLLTGISNELLEEIAKDISLRVEALELRNEKSKASELVSLSQGYYCQVPNDDDELEDILKKADIQLYKVKENNRNGYKITFGL